jgi:diacylglycerol kinase family enzyme
MVLYLEIGSSFTGQFQETRYNYAMLRSCLLYNPAAGRRNRSRLIPRIVTFLRAHGWAITVFQPTSALHFQTLAAQAAAVGYDVLIAMGGDGTVNLAARALAGTSTALAVIPTGTSNVWALETGLLKKPIPSDAEIWPAVEILPLGRRFQVDLGQVNGKIFLLWAGAGLDGLAIHHIEPRRRWSKWIPVTHYAVHTLIQLVKWHGMHLSIELDGKPIETNCSALVMANVSYYMGGITRLSSQMRIDDGFLDAWVIEGTRPIESFTQAIRLLRNRHHGKGIQHIPFQKLQARASGPLWLHTDGDPIRDTNWPLEVQVLPRQLWVLVPQSAHSLTQLES